MAKRWGNTGNTWLFLRLQNNCRWWLQPGNEKMLAVWKKSYDKPRQHIKKQRHYFADKGLSSQSYGFPSSLSCMDVQCWTIKKAECRRIDAFERWYWKRLSSLLDCKMKSVNPKGNQSWIFIRKTDLMLKLQHFGHLIGRTDSLENTLMLTKIEDRSGWQRTWWLNGINSTDKEFEQALGVGWKGKLGMLQSMGSQSWKQLSNSETSLFLWLLVICIVYLSRLAKLQFAWSSSDFIYYCSTINGYPNQNLQINMSVWLRAQHVHCL